MRFVNHQTLISGYIGKIWVSLPTNSSCCAFAPEKIGGIQFSMAGLMYWWTNFSELRPLPLLFCVGLVLHFTITCSNFVIIAFWSEEKKNKKASCRVEEVTTILGGINRLVLEVCFRGWFDHQSDLLGCFNCWGSQFFLQVNNLKNLNPLILQSLWVAPYSYLSCHGRRIFGRSQTAFGERLAGKDSTILALGYYWKYILFLKETASSFVRHGASFLLEREKNKKLTICILFESKGWGQFKTTSYFLTSWFNPFAPPLRSQQALKFSTFEKKTGT